MLRRSVRLSAYVYLEAERETSPFEALSENQVVCALISMMGRSRRSNQRPDAVMRDRITNSTESSCTARPDHTDGSTSAIGAVRAGARAAGFYAPSDEQTVSGMVRIQRNFWL